MTDDEFDPIPTDGTLALLYMIFRKVDAVQIIQREAATTRFRVEWSRHHWDTGITFRSAVEGDDLKALLNQVWEEVNQ